MDTQKSQIVERLKQANNILVTVSSNPSVDQLSAAIGLALLLNHLGKHATAVYSGQTPSTIEFLQPEKTLEKTTDSLRDFIIALDKSKADKLRYKVEDQMVKIFITPYQTSISDKDLEFSQGDFNVDVVMALGVNEQTDLDQAITSHGRILHDATVVTLGTGAGSLGSINWNDTGASSLCEMVVSIGLMLKEDVLDSQTATALLTGIVAETERFSNEKTSSETMQLSGKLMAAGANQQLVASQLQKPEEAAPIPEVSSDETPPADTPGAVSPSSPDSPPDEPPASTDGSLRIDHDDSAPEESKPSEVLPEVPEEPAETEPPAVEQIHINENGEFQPSKTEAATQPDTQSAEPSVTTESRMILDPPSMGGTLTSNMEPEGLDPAIDPLSPQTATTPILSHDSAVATQPAASPVAPDSGSTLADLEKAVESPHAAEETAPAPPEPATEPQQPTADQQPAAPDSTLEDLNAARDAVMDAVTSSPNQVLEPIQALNAQPVDLNLDNAASNPPAPEPQADAADTTESDPGLPPGIIPPEQPQGSVDEPVIINPTTPPVVDPTAPPEVPPPMVPLPMPPANPPADNSPSATAL